jgi:hypothetical protein
MLGMIRSLCEVKRTIGLKLSCAATIPQHDESHITTQISFSA